MANLHVSHGDSGKAHRGCLVEGCPCQDARIVSQRRAAFFAAWARDHGETADRSVVAEPNWRIPTITSTAA
jgi:hypothetical protein